MGTTGYMYAAAVVFREGEVILEVGGGESTRYLAMTGPPVVSVDVDHMAWTRARQIRNVEAHYGLAEDVLRGWTRPIGFAWLDGHDWPYTGNPEHYYDHQRDGYERRGQEYSQEASRQSHLTITRLIVEHLRVVAFDDTWRTHAFRTVEGGDVCFETVPPATQPAPALAMDEPFDRSTVCGLERDHPHHDDPERGWQGKGGSAIPYLIERGFHVVYYGLGQVVLDK